MGYTKDLWTKPERDHSGKKVYLRGKEQRVPNERWGKGKRWLACWLDPNEQEKTKAFANKTPADKYWVKMEAERDAGEYIDPKAGRGSLGELADRWLVSLSCDERSREIYSRIIRLHIKPRFGSRPVRSFRKPSEIREFYAAFRAKYSASYTANLTYVLGSTLELAVADGDLKTNPARTDVARAGAKISRSSSSSEVVVWSDEIVWGIIDAHPESLRTLPLVGATTGAREGELFAISEDELKFDDRTLHIQRQIKTVRNVRCFGLPKNKTERKVPLADATITAIRVHMEQYRPQPVTLPWEEPDGERRTYRLLFLHPDSGEPMRPPTYDPIWKRALAAAGVPERKLSPGEAELAAALARLAAQSRLSQRQIAAAVGVHKSWVTGVVGGYFVPTVERLAALLDAVEACAADRAAVMKLGQACSRSRTSYHDRRHQLRHYYANMELAGGTTIPELAQYLGHADAGFTLRVYGHLRPDSHDRARAAVDAVFFRPRAVSDGT